MTSCNCPYPCSIHSKAVEDASKIHKPEPMHYGKCPECGKLRVCVLLTLRDQDATQSEKPLVGKIRRYYVRKHACGSRRVPVAGSLREIESGIVLTHSGSREQS